MPTSLTTITQGILDFLKTQWALTPSSAVPIAYPNYPYKPTGVSFIAPHLVPDETVRAHITGDPNTGHLEKGLLMVRVLTPKNKGEAAMNDLIDELDGIFKEQSTNTIDFFVPDVQLVSGEENAWYIKNFVIRYERQN